MATLRIALALVMLLSVHSTVNAFDFYYFVLQWPGSYCDSQQSCCYSEKPTDFIIHGLQPAKNDGTKPSSCNNLPFDIKTVESLVPALKTQWPSLQCPDHDSQGYWSSVWEKRGTCAYPKLDQFNYFNTCLNLNNKLDILQVLADAGVKPDGGFYSKSRLSKAIKRATGTEVGIRCNADESNNDQFFEIYICVDKSGTDFIDCPALPTSVVTSCATNAIEFPAF